MLRLSEGLWCWCATRLFIGWVDICVCKGTYIYVYIYIYIHIMHAYNTVYIYTYMYMYSYIYIHYITLHCIALHCITLHYIHTYIPTYMYIYIYIYIYHTCEWASLLNLSNFMVAGFRHLSRSFSAGWSWLAGLAGAMRCQWSPKLIWDIQI